MMTDTSPTLSRGRPASNSRAGDGTARAQEAELRALVAAIAAGDQAAMTRLYETTCRIVHALALRIVGEGDVAEEVVLDVYLQVWRRAATFDAERGQVTTWLLTMARSRALDRRRSSLARAQREEGWSDALADGAADCTCGCDPVVERTRRERRDSVRSAMSALPDEQRRALELAFFPGLSHTEIAVRLGEPLGTVKTRIRLGLLKLRDTLKEWEEPS